MSRQLINETGNHYGRLTVIQFDHYDARREAYWRCRCDCGNETVTRGRCLRTGETQSCGCIARETRVRGGRHAPVDAPLSTPEAGNAVVICIRCRKSPMYRDDLTVDVLACPVCGARLYPKFPPRSGKQDQEMKRQEMRRIREELVLSGLLDEQTKPCARCKTTQVPAGTTYCGPCQKEINRVNVAAWKKAHPEAYAATQQRYYDRQKQERAGA